MSDELVYVCEICQTVLTEHHCKAVCPNCGRMFDCSDLPILHANGQIRSDERYVAYPGSEADLLPPLEPADYSSQQDTRESRAPSPVQIGDESAADLP